MPYPNEHSCRLHGPGLYDPDSFRRIKRDSLVIIIGKRKGKDTTEAQAYRYPTGDWTEADAKAHCKEEGGTFHPAAEEGKAMFDTIEIDGVEVPLDELVGIYKGVKSVNIEEQSRMVRDTWYAKFRKPSAPGIEPESYWVKEVFDDQVIVEAPDGLYSYPYTTDDEGKIEFGEPVKVEVVYQPVKSVGFDPSPYAVKAIREENGGVVVGGYLCLWGDPDNRDLQDEYFTPETELWLEAYKAAPALFHHGLDTTVGLEVMGHRVDAKTDDTGAWVEDWLNKSSRFWQLVEPLLKAQALFYSPGSAPHLVKRADDGRLLSFPVVEDTLTPVPAQYRLHSRPVEQIKAAYKAAGIELPEGLSAGASEAGPGPGAGAPSQEATETQIEAAKARIKAIELSIQIEQED